jgi:hypothetical protein
MKKDKLPQVKFAIVPGNGSALFNAGTAIEITLKAREVHR